MKKILVGLIITILALVALFFIIPLFLSEKVVVKRSIEINKPVSEVFSFLRLQKNMKYYSVWYEMDMDAVRIYEGIDGEEGAVFRWDSQKEDVGAGEQILTTVEPNKKIESKIRFTRPFETTNYATFDFEEEEINITQVSWTLVAEFPYPSNIMLLFYNIEKEVGDDFEYSLKKLKVVLN